MNKYRDLIVGIFFLLFSIFYYTKSLTIVEAGVSSVGPAFVPRVVAGMTALLSILLITSSVLKLRKRVSERSHQKYSDMNNIKEKINYLAVTLTVVLLFVYILCLEPVGFIPATIVYLFLQFNIAAPKDQKTFKYQKFYLLGSVVTALVVNYTFVNGFYIMLPQGILG